MTFRILKNNNNKENKKGRFFNFKEILKNRGDLNLKCEV